MLQGTIVAKEDCVSNGKKLEYFLLAPNDEEEKTYALAAFSEKDGVASYAVTHDLPNNKKQAIRLFFWVVGGTVRPEALGETVEEWVLTEKGEDHEMSVLR